MRTTDSKGRLCRPIGTRKQTKDEEERVKEKPRQKLWLQKKDGKSRRNKQGATSRRCDRRNWQRPFGGEARVNADCDLAAESEKGDTTISHQASLDANGKRRATATY